MSDRRWNPFLYPEKRHKRQEKPPLLTKYRYFKPYVRREFGRQCVYCRMPDGLRGAALFAVEHYRPKQKFPDISCTYSNLFYACLNCNSRKGQYWPSTIQRNAHRYIVNPCDYAMTHHLKFDRERVGPRSGAGSFMEKRLDLNMQEIVDVRAFILSSIRDNMRRRRKAKESIERLDALLTRETDPAKRARFEAQRDETTDLLNSAERYLRLLLSTEALPT